MWATAMLTLLPALVLVVAVAGVPVPPLQQSQQQAATTTTTATASANPAAEPLRFHGGHRHGHRRPRAPSPPPPPPPPAPTPAPPSPPGTVVPLPCNHSVVPPMLRGQSVDGTPTEDDDDCIPTPPPPPPPPVHPPSPPKCLCPCPCARPPRAAAPPRHPGFPFPPPAPPAAAAANPMECVAPMAALMTCGAFLTGSETEAPAPTSACCSGLGNFVSTSNAVAAAGGGDRLLRCLCPVVRGEVNRMLPKPVTPVRMMLLPIACGVVLPPQLLTVCFAGQQQAQPQLVGGHS